MNILFSSVFLISAIVLLITNPENLMNIALSGATKGVQLSFSLIAIYAFMMGILELVEKTGLNKKLAKILQPILNFLFGKQSEEANEQIAINLSSNILGMGNASIPSGIKAMKLMDKKDGKLNLGMAMLFVINSMSLQIIPTTILGLRASNGSTNSACVILPILLASFISTTIGILCVKFMFKGRSNE